MSKIKSKKIWSNLGNIITIVLLLAVFFLLIGTVFSSRERNPKNLIKVDDKYLSSRRTDYGLEVVVEDDGVIKLKGQTTRNEKLDVQTLTLPAGTYTISGIEKPNLAKITLQATWGAGNVAFAGLESETFTLEADTLVTVSIVIEGSEGEEETIEWANRTIKPVIVSGKEPGEFYV